MDARHMPMSKRDSIWPMPHRVEVLAESEAGIPSIRVLPFCAR
jgi:hypothetical protein